MLSLQLAAYCLFFLQLVTGARSSGIDTPSHGRSQAFRSQLKSVDQRPTEGTEFVKDHQDAQMTSRGTDWFFGTFLQDPGNLAAWNKMLNNPFCAQYSTVTNETALLPHFKWYMLQDLLYLRHWVSFRLGWLSTADWNTLISTDWQTTLADDYSFALSSDTDLTDPDNLNISQATIDAATPSSVVQTYMDFMTNATHTQDFFAMWIVSAPCIVGYQALANKYYQQPGVNTAAVKELLTEVAWLDTKWYQLWVEPNEGTSYIDEWTGFIDANHLAYGSDDPSVVAVWNSLFQQGCQNELAFWTAALEPGNVVNN
ncbi:hypothetical protein H0H92_003044 [Tricholoma furcatifolium]|nr:hypothetical protein H0H92_003044 [Tricholoma furcatifolium]